MAWKESDGGSAGSYGLEWEDDTGGKAARDDVRRGRERCRGRVEWRTRLSKQSSLNSRQARRGSISWLVGREADQTKLKRTQRPISRRVGWFIWAT